MQVQVQVLAEAAAEAAAVVVMPALAQVAVLTGVLGAPPFLVAVLTAPAAPAAPVAFAAPDGLGRRLAKQSHKQT